MAEENQINPEPAVTPLAEVIEQEMPQQISSGSTERAEVGRSGRSRRGKKNPTASPINGGEMLSQAKAQLRTLKQDTDDYVRRNPGRAILTALAIGFVLALMRRGR